ncbi:MAG: SusC/RagA family TonB-linked outer membrane protein [Cyclobacteriaceae bacterium]
MNKIYRKALFLLLMLSCQLSMAQNRTISGVVRDALDDSPIIGANVIIKGSPRGTITDVDGNFKIDLGPNENTLTFSYIGYGSEEIELGNRTYVEVALFMELKELGEIVVTAFGIEQEKKALNYAVQELKSDDITRTQQSNIVNAMQGQIAGVQITGGGAPGAPSQILIRGGSSVGDGRDNQPLFIVDGIPIDNSALETGGNRAMDLNPADIESLTVLKGPSAAALYGVLAANGAVIITTKSGQAGKTVVNFGANVAFDRPTRYMPQQRTFQRGINGRPDNTTVSSWGPTYRRDQQIFDNQENFFDTGVTQNYDINVSGGTENTRLYFSYSMLDQTGIVPMTDYDRHNFLMKGSNKLRKNLTLGASANFITSKNTRAFSNSSGGFMNIVMNWPLSDDMRNYRNPDGTRRFLQPIDLVPAQTDNPYWYLENNPTIDNVNRWISQANLVYEPLDWLTFTYRIGLDRTNFHMKRQRAISTGGNGVGSVQDMERDNQIITSDIHASINKKIAPKLTIFGIVGNSVRIDESRTMDVFGEGLLNEGLYTINNAERRIPTSSLTRRNIVGVFGDIKLDYNGIAYLNATARNDWSSTLPLDNRSFFYPSVSAGLIFSELLNLNQSGFSYGKIRASWAQVGFDAPPHRLFPVLVPNLSLGGGFANFHTAGNPNLKPETTTSMEVGAELKFFNNRFGIDFTYYDMLTVDQIISARVSPATGYVIQTFNAGSVSNKGVEIMINATPIKKTNFTWNLNLNMSQNRAVLESLPSHMSEYRQTYGQTSAGNSSSRPGMPLFGVSGIDYVYNEQGQKVIGENGYPLKKGAMDNYLGNREPDMIIGLNNNFTYRDFSLSFLWDFRVGGKVLNATAQGMIGRGTHIMLEDYRDMKFVFDGVINIGTEESPVWEENTQEVVLDQLYFQNEYSVVGANFLEDASWARLRFVNLSYNLPKTWGSKLGMSNLQVTATGRNLLLFTPYSGMDPEVSSAGNRGGSGTMGIDFGAIPQMKGLTFGINASF